jgi:hypothetical protein
MRTVLNSLLFLLVSIGTSFGQRCGDFSDKPTPKPGEGEISCTESNNIVTWKISRPEVRRRITEYPEIDFRPNDIVRVDASGCVDPGGVGNTWKQYVNPSGLNTDRLYHGLIWIPGAEVVDGKKQLIVPVGTSLVRIASITARPNNKPAAQELIVGEHFPAGVPHTLHLGYEDDQYDDNGYPHNIYDSAGNLIQRVPHGDRDGNDCKNADDAYVIIQISRSTAPPAPNTLGPLDPVASNYDQNGFQLSPAWFQNYPADPPHLKKPIASAPLQTVMVNGMTAHPVDQVDVLKECGNFRYLNPLLVHEGVDSSCTRQVSLDQPPSLSQCLLEPGFGEFHGHVNWAPATYYGRITFEEFSTDNDLDFDLFDFLPKDSSARFFSWQPPGWWEKSETVNPILTKDSQVSAEYLGNLHLEFGGYEVTEFFSKPNLPDSERDRGWQMFRYVYASSLAHSDPVKRKEELQRLIDGKTASVTGLLNLDCVHECHTELHPVQAMAIRTRREDCYQSKILTEIPPPGLKGEKPVSIKCDTKELDTRTDDSWLIFARNSGNEGSCSLDQHWVDRDVIRIFLPKPVGAKNDIPVVRGDDLDSKDKNHIFFSNFPGIKWRMDRDDKQQGVIITLFLKPDGCLTPQPASGANIRVHGALHLNWMTDDDKAAQLRFDPVGDYKFGSSSHDRQATNGSILKSLAQNQFYDLEPVKLADADETRPKVCNPEKADKPSIDLINARIIHDAHDAEDQLMRQRVLIKPVSLFSKETLRSLFTDYVKANVGMFWQDLKIPNAANMSQGGGLRSELLQTPLGSFEFEGAFTHLHSASAQDLWTFDYLYGLRIQLIRQGAIYVEPKGGNLRRWTGIETAPGSNYSRFHGSDSFFFIGGGFQLGKRLGRAPVRIGAGVMILPGTGERIFRVTIGPQFQFSK